MEDAAAHALNRPVEQLLPEAQRFFSTALERVAEQRALPLARVMRRRVMKCTAFLQRMVDLQRDSHELIQRLSRSKPEADVAYVRAVFARTFEQSMLLQRVQMQAIELAQLLLPHAAEDPSLGDSVRVFLDANVASLRYQAACLEYWAACFREDFDLARLPAPLPSFLPRAVPIDSASPVRRRFGRIGDVLCWLDLTLLLSSHDPSEISIWQLLKKRLAWALIADGACSIYLGLRRLTPKYTEFRGFNFANFDLQAIVEFYQGLLEHARASDSNQVRKRAMDLVSVLCALPPGDPARLLERLGPPAPRGAVRSEGMARAACAA